MNGTQESYNVARFPTLTAYLRGLPAGWSSHPQCKARASMLVALKERPSHRLEPGELPASLQTLLDDPPLPTSWVEEVRIVGLQLAIRDAFYESDHTWLEYIREANAGLAASTMFRPVLGSGDPVRALRNVTDNWKHFHTGSVFRIVTLDEVERRGKLSLRYPRNLFPELRARGFGIVAEVVMQLAGGIAARVVTDETTAEFTNYSVSW